MSAVAGILFFNGDALVPDLIEKLTSSMSARGPDSQANWVSGSVGLGHCMLQTVAFSVGFFGAAFRAGRRFFTRMFSDPIRAVIALQNESAFEWMQRGMVLDDTLLRVHTECKEEKRYLCLLLSHLHLIHDTKALKVAVIGKVDFNGLLKNTPSKTQNCLI